MSYFERISELMQEQGVTAVKLAAAVGVSTGNITDWKKGRSKPSSDAIAKLAEYFGVTSDYLLGLSDSRYPRESLALSSDIPYDELPWEDVKQIRDFIVFLKEQHKKNQ